MPLNGNPAEWTGSTRQVVIRDALNAQTNVADHTGGTAPDGKSKCSVCRAAARRLYDSVGTAPLIYKSAGREMPQGKARWDRFSANVREVHAHLIDWEAQPTPAAPTIPYVDPTPVVEPTPTPVPTGERVTSEHRRFLAEVRRIRKFAEEREIDHISYRPVKDGAKMISAGIPVEACLHAMTIQWEDADRRQAGIAPYDPATDFPGGLHAYLDALVSAGVMIYLYGPAGMGKSYWCEELASRMNVDFSFTPMTEGALPSWLLGKVDLEGFKATKFLNIWVNGGVYLFDEMPAADPNMLMVMNGPLANDLLENPVDQTSYRKSPKCVIIGAGNTLGTGPDAQYTGTNQLDFSTLDRFRMGRAFVGYDADVEELVLVQNA